MPTTSTLIPVNVTIADRTYRLKLDAKDEETVRKSIKIINDKIIEYKANLAGKDMQDFVAMVLLWFATEQTKASNKFVLNTEIDDEIISIEKLLQKALIQNTINNQNELNDIIDLNVTNPKTT